MSASLEEMLAAPPVPATRRLHYGTSAEQVIDLYLPAGVGPHPLVVALHGGFWRSRYDLAHLSHACDALAAEGFAVASIEYRRLGHEGGGYPGTLHDVAAAAASLSAQLDTWAVDPARIVALGHSAGGQLALWLAARAVREAGSGTLSFRGVVALAPVSDLIRGHALGLGAGVIDTFLGGTPETAAPAYSASSPAAQLPLGVRQVVIHGEHDADVPLALSEQYVQHALERGDDARLVTLPGADHYCVVNPRSAEWPQVVAAVRELAS